MRYSGLLRSRFIFCILLLSCGALESAGAAGPELILCGGNEVFIWDVDADSNPKVWSWKASDHPEIPLEIRGRFQTTDDCKATDGGTNILITSSGGGVALVERATGRTVFWAEVANAHSAEMLPAGRIAVAGSTAERGNRIALFDRTRPGHELLSHPLHGAHGLFWNSGIGCLWALGEFELLAFKLDDWEGPAPRLIVDRKIRLPDPGGHDLRSVPGSEDLFITTRGHVWVFNQRDLAFRPHAHLGQFLDVKSVDMHPGSGRIAYVQAEISWWAERVKMLMPDGELKFPGQKIYKARWVP